MIAGNFLADYLVNKEVLLLPEEVQRGVALHRIIDQFTDQHECIRSSNRLLMPVHGKYAPVIMDVLMDYLLLKNWNQYSRTPILEFTAMIYEALMMYHSIMPDFLRERLPLMIRENWLVHYGTEEGLEFTFSRMKLRSSQPWKFDHALKSLEAHFEDLDAAFNLFFPEMSEVATSWRRGEIK
ncbi:MAG: hypothetical protein RI973_1290 [Bacteroidota bacterium]